MPEVETRWSGGGGLREALVLAVVLGAGFILPLALSARSQALLRWAESPSHAARAAGGPRQTVVPDPTDRPGSAILRMRLWRRAGILDMHEDRLACLGRRMQRPAVRDNLAKERQGLAVDLRRARQRLTAAKQLATSASVPGGEERVEAMLQQLQRDCRDIGSRLRLLERRMGGGPASRPRTRRAREHR